MKVLIVEDEPVSRKKLEHFLVRWGYEVVTARNGREALGLFQKEPVPIVITDWVMPEMDGLELVNAIRQLDLPEYVYIIMLTAKSDQKDLITGLEVGADEFVSKPFNQEELRARLNSGERILKLEKSLARNNAELKAANEQLQAANRQMKLDLEAAARIQASILPAEAPDIKGVRFSWQFRPCDELAGDIFNVFKLDEKQIGIYVLDVSGHGVPAALLAFSLSQMLSPILDQASILKKYANSPPGYRISPPQEVLIHLNNRFQIDTENGQFFTLLYGIFNTETRIFRFASAGHPGMILLPFEDSARLVQIPSLPIGFLENNQYEEHTLQLSPGDRLYLYSDGISEAENSERELFGVQKMMKILENARNAPLENSLTSLFDAVEDWANSKSLKDDATLLAIEITPS